MNNDEFNTNPADSVPSEAPNGSQDISSSPAFNYDAPTVDVPEAPKSVDNIPKVVDTPVSDVSQVEGQPQEFPYQQPNYNTQQQGNPYQQPNYNTQQQGNPYQQPNYNTQQQGNPYQQPNYNTQQQGNPYQQGSSYSGYYQYTPVNPMLVNGNKTTDGFAIASLILGIVGICTCCTGFPSILGLIFGIVSIAQNHGDRPTGVAVAGIVTSVIGILLTIMFWGIGLLAN